MYKLDNTTCSSMQLTCGRWYLPNKDPVQCRYCPSVSDGGDIDGGDSEEDDNDEGDQLTYGRSGTCLTKTLTSAGIFICVDTGGGACGKDDDVGDWDGGLLRFAILCCCFSMRLECWSWSR